MSYDVRPVREVDWETFRAVRMEALADAPSSFGSTLADARLLSDDVWRERARGSATRRMFLAWLGTEPVGLAGAIDEDDGSAQVVSVWVRSDHRGRGVAHQLSSAAVRFAQDAGLEPVRLWVTDGNDRAIALYARLGFAPTGRSQPLPSDPTLQEHEYELRGGSRRGTGNHPLG